MEKLSRDPLINAIQQGIKRGIDVAIENECFGSAIILIYSAMDAMAYLGIPAAQDNVRGSDFVKWAEAYIRFPCKEQVTGLELYGARCATLHTYGVVSKLSREGKARMIGYGNHMVPEVLFRPKISQELVMVSIQGLRDVLFSGIDRYLIDLFADATRAPTAEKRLNWLVNTFAVKPDTSTSS